MKKRLIMLGLLILTVAFTFNNIAAAGKIKPFGNPRAKKGGQVTLIGYEFPKSFNFYTTYSAGAYDINLLIYERLAEVHPETLQFVPRLAESWTIGSDKKTYTIKINKQARWADGKPVTAEDVKFTYDVIMNPKNMTPVARMYMGRFEEPKIINRYTIQFHAKDVHFYNLVTLLYDNFILPKHLYEGKDFNKAFNMSLPPGSGPYILSDVKEGRYYTLTRRKDYWGYKALPHLAGLYNFDRIKIKIISNENMAFEAFKKGDFDIFGESMAKRWLNDTNSEKFKKNWIIKKKIFNDYPRSFSGFALNMRKSPFNDIRVRQAIFHLFDRRKLLEKLMFNQYEPANSYWPSLNNNNPMIEYDPAKAKKLLAEAGYRKLGPDGFLINEKGQRMEFTLYYYWDTFEKHFTVFVEDCKKAGVKVNLVLLSGANVQKKADEFNFEAMHFGWATTLFEDPEQLWHSRHANEKGSSNLCGYNNPEVDKLIDSITGMFDANRRNEIIRKLDAIIYKDTPYILLWEANYMRLYYRNVFGMPKTVFSRIGGAEDIYAYWWYEPEKEKALKEAERLNKPLPMEPVEVYYHKISGK